MEKKILQCPKCHIDMKSQQHMERNIHICPKCEGSFVAQKDISWVLEKLYGVLKEKYGPKKKVEVIPDKGIRIQCPCCEKTMDQHGYMGSKDVIIDLCNDCGLLYMDKYELSVMALLVGQLKECNQALEFTKRLNYDVLSMGVMNQVNYGMIFLLF